MAKSKKDESEAKTEAPSVEETGILIPLPIDPPEPEPEPPPTEPEPGPEMPEKPDEPPPANAAEAHDRHLDQAEINTSLHGNDHDAKPPPAR